MSEETFMKRNRLLHRLLGPLHMHFRVAQATYVDYLENGRSFLFANSLRRINLSARQLLLSRGYMLSETMQAEATKLIQHYDVWLTYWDDLARRTCPSMDQEFVFENRFTYPKEAEEILERLYEEVSQRQSQE